MTNSKSFSPFYFLGANSILLFGLSVNAIIHAMQHYFRVLVSWLLHSYVYLAKYYISQYYELGVVLQLTYAWFAFWVAKRPSRWIWLTHHQLWRVWELPYLGGQTRPQSFAKVQVE